MEGYSLTIPRSRPAASSAKYIHSPAVPVTPTKKQLDPALNEHAIPMLPDQLPPSPRNQSTPYRTNSHTIFWSANRGRRSPNSTNGPQRSPSLHSKRSNNYLRHAVRPPHDASFSPRRFTPRSSPRKLRNVASTPLLHSYSAKKTLRPRSSRLDLLDKSQITSFPSMPPKNSTVETEQPPLTQTDNSLSEAFDRLSTLGTVDIIDNYIPHPFGHQKPKIDEVDAPIELLDDRNWVDIVWRKLRWRWRLQGLIH